jgi:hypothetical protein
LSIHFLVEILLILIPLLPVRTGSVPVLIGNF